MTRTLALLITCLLASGCAVTEARNRHTLNALDERLAPSSSAGRWAAAPVALPTALMGLTADALVVHPVTVVDDAWRDTREWLWTPDPSESRFRRAVLFPLTVVATPFVYVGDWLMRAAFAIGSNDT
ncbi:MAG: hypothetical protein ACREI7_04915 [Myxococcota bacterium]